jgi:cytochrome bd ubiquinol oxidase subunit I
MLETSDVLILARLQFAFTISAHILFPAISIGLANYLAVLEGLWLRTGNAVYRGLFFFWSKIFAVGFGMGVVSGVVMSYEFGTNWAGFSRIAGSVNGPLLTYEVLTAFFLEAGFLGIMLFGWKRVGARLHFLATVLVALGTLFSTFWILASNSWMQTPQGFEIVDGRVVPLDWLKIIFNPSFPFRLVHMSLAAFIVAATIVAGCAAWNLLHGRRGAGVKKSFSMAVGMILVAVPLQMIAGDQHGLNTLEHQPAKIAAIEGLWETEKGGTSLNLIGWPDMRDEQTKYALSVPHLGSVILTHTWSGEIRGLKEFAREDRPNSTIVFWSFRVMVGLGLLMLLLGVLGLILRLRNKLYDARWFQRFALAMGPSGLIALLAGWITTEVGRQPWVVYGVLRTADAVSPLSSQQVGTSLLIIVIVYFLVFGSGTYYMLKLMAKGPDDGEEAAQAGDGSGESIAALGHRPMSRATDPIDE